jgi:hypothetical protein
VKTDAAHITQNQQTGSNVSVRRSNLDRTLSGSSLVAATSAMTNASTFTQLPAPHGRLHTFVCNGQMPSLCKVNQLVRHAARRQARPPARSNRVGDAVACIGGLTRCGPTVTRGAAQRPSVSLCATINTLRPRFRSARVAGANMTTGIRGGTRFSVTTVSG